MINLSPPRPRQLLRHGIPILALAICGTLLWQRLTAMDMGAVRTAIGDVRFEQWLLALTATWFSFLAIGRYDAVWHKVMRTGVSPIVARRAGMRAIAVAQMLGFGAVTGCMVRWRCLPSLSLWQATRLSLAVTIAFTMCWASFGVAALWWSGTGSALSLPHVVGLIIIGCIGVAFARHQFAPDLTISDLRQLMIWTAVDMCCAAIALYVLLPAAVDFSFAAVLTAYILALGVGLLSNAPGGAGAFDLTLLALLPMDVPEPLVAGVVAFRIIYYLLPASLALVSLARPVRQASTDDYAPSHWCLARQSGEIRWINSQRWFLAELPCVTAAMGPTHPDTSSTPDLRGLRRHALMRGKAPAIYNCDPRLAMSARKAGWYVRRTAMEALIRPDLWSTAGSKKQTLRRKLRNAAAANVCASHADAKLPIPQMQAIARRWALSHGGELGLSMGRYCPVLVQNQQVILVHQDHRLIGFVTFHTSATGWTLDLIRHADGIPDGSIQTAIVAAIDSARQAQVPVVSLACAPDPRHTPAYWADRKAGLIQFKRGFVPIWVPRYHAAPTRSAFWMTGLIIGIAIHRPLANAPNKFATMIMMIMQKYQHLSWRFRLKSGKGRDSRPSSPGKELES